MDMPMDMQNQVMGYDRTATMFSPDGHLLQVEYAEKTVRLGSASIGFKCKNGVVIISDKRIKDKLVEPDSANKIYEIDHHIISSAAGILSDARILVERSQILAQQHKVTYDSDIEVENIIKEISNLKQTFTQYGGARPFGASILIAGVSNKKSKLYVSDVTGNYLGYNATAIGENDEKIKDLLRKEYKEDITIEQAIKLGLRIFKKILEKDFSIDRFDVAYIEKDKLKIIREYGDSLKKYQK